jgi:hypothetical protein
MNTPLPQTAEAVSSVPRIIILLRLVRASSLLECSLSHPLISLRCRKVKELIDIEPFNAFHTLKESKGLLGPSNAVLKRLGVDFREVNVFLQRGINVLNGDARRAFPYQETTKQPLTAFDAGDVVRVCPSRGRAFFFVHDLEESAIVSSIFLLNEDGPMEPRVSKCPVRSIIGILRPSIALEVDCNIYSVFVFFGHFE